MSLPSPKRLILFSLSVALTAPAHAQSDTILHRVDVHYNHLHTLRARYTEHYTGMGLDRTESGTLTLKKPGLMRWAYDAPAGKLFVLDGRYAWFYTPGDAQVSRTLAKQLDDLRSPLRFLLGHTELARELDHLTITPEGSPGPDHQPQAFRIAGIPKGMANRVRLLTLVVSPAGAIQQIRLEETDGATTEFTFADMDENVAVKATDFTFTPPPGVAVVDGLPPI